MAIDRIKNQNRDLLRKLKSLNLRAVQQPKGILWASNAEVLPDGVYYHPQFLTCEQEHQILSQIDNKPWANAIARRQQFWGEVYYHTTHDLPSIQPILSDSEQAAQSVDADQHNAREYDNSEKGTIFDVLPLQDFSWLLDLFDDEQFSDLVKATDAGHYIYHDAHRTYSATPPGVFTALKDNANGTGVAEEVEQVTQILVNEYTNQIGISSHIDDPDAFGKVLVMISLQNPVYMRLRETATRRECSILLEPRSLLILKGCARYEWEHGISHQKWIFTPRSGVISVNCLDDIHLTCRDEHYRRISLTIRHLLPGRKQCKVENKEIEKRPPPQAPKNHQGR
ncbi:hypothetical protein MIR68_007383 [Amoeboaphelidium protococcarum]|nr:hypothetical protein MIR68_007383 [Amoeboaphelidium protococcarum]